MSARTWCGLTARAWAVAGVCAFAWGYVIADGLHHGSAVILAAGFLFACVLWAPYWSEQLRERRYRRSIRRSAR